MPEAHTFLNPKSIRVGVRALLLLALFVQLTGCAHQITTLPSAVAPMPEGAPAMSLPPRSVTDLGSTPAMTFAHFDAELRNTILREGNGQVTWDAEEPALVLSEVSLRATSAKPSNFFFGVAMGMLSLAPPIAFVPEFRKSTYVVDYAIDDRSGRQVLSGQIEGQVEGRYQGMYIGRIEAESRLIEGQGQFVSEEAGRRLLSEIRAKNDLLKKAVAYYRANPQATEEERKSAQRNRHARATRQASFFAQSTKLIEMKKFQGPPAPVFGSPGAEVPLYEPGAGGPPAMLAFSSAPKRQGGFRAAPVEPTGSVVQTARPAPSFRASSRVIVIPPRVSMGAKSPMQDRVLSNTMRSKLGETRELVSEDETSTLLKAAAQATADASCSTEACRKDLRERAGASHAFALEILRDGSGTQLVVHVSGVNGNDSRSKFCAACDTAKLDESLGAITGAMAELAHPMTSTAMIAPGAGAVPAMMQPAPEATSVGSQVVDSVVDSVAECAAKFAAEQACSAIPSFGGTACRIAVNVKFKGAICP